MGFLEKRQEFRPKTGEAPFQDDEMFFSRTDKRGIILSGNYIFKRVSYYDWDELLGSPHKLIRHPDMPKGVFWLFWDTLKRGIPIGAYVKNQAKDGLFYWVYAMAMPFEDGYLSLRIKPTSDMLQVIQEEYENLRKAETNDGLSPKESAAVLLGRINDLGFADYTAFESDCLMRELAARDRKMGNPENPAFVVFSEMMAIATDLKRATTKLAERFKAISTVPTNMRIIAARLEPSGGAISSLAQNYSEMSEEMSNWFSQNVSNADSDFATIHGTINSCRFMFGVAQTLQVQSENYNQERRSLGGRDLALEQRQINALVQQYIAKAMAGVRNVADVAGQINRSVGIMRRFTLGLSSTRVMCNIESARIPESGGNLIDVINQLGVFQLAVEKQLDQIQQLCLNIQEHVEEIGDFQGPQRAGKMKSIISN